MKPIFKITKESGIPLIGLVQIGLIDRGTNLIQVRPTTVCNLNCIFCSTDSGPFSKYHITDYEIECDYLLEELDKIAKYKDVKLEANIDSVGEPLAYPNILELIKGLKQNKNISYISMQTNGTLLTKDLVKNLESAGLNRINLSIETLNPELAKKICGVENYDLNKIIGIAKFIKTTNIELLIAPVWLPKLNDKDIEDIIEFAKSINAKLGIQNYEVYKLGRKAKGTKAVTYWKFYKKLEELEKIHNIKLKISPKDFGIAHAKRLPKPFFKGDKLICEVVMPGWIKNQAIAMANGRCLTVLNCNKKIGEKVKVRILEDKNNIFITTPV